MKREDFDILTNEIWESIMSTRNQGQDEYARTETDVLSNFKRITNWQGTNQENVLMT